MRVVLHLAVTQDGFIAKEDGDSDWVTNTDEQLFFERAKDAGCLVVGKKTFEQYKGKIYPVADALNIVLSKETSRDEVVYADSPERAIDLAEKKGCKAVVVAGGAQTSKSFLNKGLIRDVFYSVHPLKLGSGIPAPDIANDPRYSLVETKMLPEGVKELHFAMI